LINVGYCLVKHEQKLPDPLFGLAPAQSGNGYDLPSKVMVKGDSVDY